MDKLQIRLSSVDNKRFRDYAKLHGQNLRTALMNDFRCYVYYTWDGIMTAKFLDEAGMIEFSLSFY